MCRMVDTGTRWKREIPLPDFGFTSRYLAVRYEAVSGPEVRYVPSPEPWCDEAAKEWLKPLYAIRIKARSI